MKKKFLENVKIESLGYGGVGIATHESGKKILIKGALPGTVVDCRIIKFRREYMEGQITRVHQFPVGLQTAEVRCPHFLGNYQTHADTMPPHKRGCGGCKRQGIAYDQQRQLKYDILVDCFKKFFAAYGEVPVYDTLASPLQFGYRNKIEFTFGKFLQKNQNDEAGFAVEEHRNMGFHQQGNFSKVIDVDRCYLISPRMHAVYEEIKAALDASGLPVYDAKTHQGFLRHCVIREGVRTDQILVILSVATDRLKDHPDDDAKRKGLLDDRCHNHALQTHITTLVVNANNGLADSVQSPDSVVTTIRGKGYIFEELHLPECKPLRFQISPFSFFQTNTLGAEVLFQVVRNHITHVKGNILDLYCGGGTIGIICKEAGLGKKLIGIEIVESAIDDAKKNARINGLEDESVFFAGKAESVLSTHIQEEYFQGGDLIIVDPPRSGLHPNVITFLCDLKKRSSFKLLYISCNPVTMAHDVALLTERGGFSLQFLQPVDLFPHTHHLETVGVLL